MSITVPKTTNNLVDHRPGGWLPVDRKLHLEWLGKLAGRAEKDLKAGLYIHPSIQAFWTLIEGNQQVRMLFHMMFEQIPPYPPYLEDPIGTRQIRDWKVLLYAFNLQLTKGPIWLYNTEGQKGLIGFPFNAILVCLWFQLRRFVVTI
jgi:phosphatidylserine decarboxylase